LIKENYQLVKLCVYEDHSFNKLNTVFKEMMFLPRRLDFNQTVSLTSTSPSTASAGSPRKNDKTTPSKSQCNQTISQEGTEKEERKLNAEQADIQKINHVKSE
jgi:hypothetical protein